jgi:excisionase family DNA binding protein
VVKHPPPATRRLVGINQAAKYADVHPITLRRWVAAGRVPAYRAGPRLLKIDLNELDAMLSPVVTAGGDLHAV